MTGIDRKDLQEVVDKVNAMVQSERELMRRRFASGRFDREFVDEMQTYFKSERQEYGAWFNDLVKNKRLSSEARTKCLKYVREGVTFETHADQRKGVPFVEAVPQFREDISQIAYVLIQLANQKETPYRIVSCKWCGKFILKERRSKRLYCNARHQNNFSVRESRKAKKGST